MTASTDYFVEVAALPSLSLTFYRNLKSIIPNLRDQLVTGSLPLEKYGAEQAYGLHRDIMLLVSTTGLPLMPVFNFDACVNTSRSVNADRLPTRPE